MLNWLSSVEWSKIEWAVVFATLMGPVAAVQVQKFIEVRKQRRDQKVRVFETLMTTRGTSLAQEHVRALNMIELAFYGRTILFWHLPTRTERIVLAAWRDYLDHLTPRGIDNDVWEATRFNLFTELLIAMAADLKMSFDRTILKRGAYFPQAHSELENEQKAIRRLLIDLLSGRSAMRTTTVGAPSAPLQEAPALNVVDGLWTVQFVGSNKSFGHGIVAISKGTILGGDPEFYYSGNYMLIDGRAAVSVRARHYHGIGNSIFGQVKEFNLNVSGEPGATEMRMQGFVVERPEFQIILDFKRLE